MPRHFLDGGEAGTCNKCGKPAWSPRSNKCEEHRPAPVAKSPRAKRPNNKVTPIKADGSPKGTVTRIVDVAGAIDAKTFSGRPPTAAEWEEKLTALVVLLTMTYVEYAVVRPTKLPEPEATQAVSVLGMTNEEAETIVGPFAYLIARTPINKKHGREAIELLAFAPAILAVIAWNERVQSFKKEMAQANQGAQSVSLQSPPTEEGGPAVANFGGPGVWDPRQAPTSGVNGNGAHVDDPARGVPA